MSDLLKLLDRSITDVRDGLVGKSHDELTQLRAAEADGKTRAGVLAAIDAALGTSGAPHQIVSDVDPSHPAVDNDPRANTTADQNRIDFNDPTLTGQEAVTRNLAAHQGE